MLHHEHHLSLLIQRNLRNVRRPLPSKSDQMAFRNWLSKEITQYMLIQHALVAKAMRRTRRTVLGAPRLKQVRVQRHWRPESISVEKLQVNFDIGTGRNVLTLYIMVRELRKDQFWITITNKRNFGYGVGQIKIAKMNKGPEETCEIRSNPFPFLVGNKGFGR